jgi:oligopeptide transport system ATP-binding protein
MSDVHHTGAVHRTLAASDAPLLRIEELTVRFPAPGGDVLAVRDVSLDVRPGEGVAILGESGSGKSVTSRAVLGLVDAPPAIISGSIVFDGEDIIVATPRRLRDIRGRGIAMVFQDALDGLNPVFSIGAQLTEVLRVRLGRSSAQARDEAIALMGAVGIPQAAERFGRYPHQFSGGMRQRICIALAIALHPRLLIADEPTTALDRTVQAGILRLLLQLQRESGMALILVTHDLDVARSVASRLVVMYAGQIVEEGPVESLFTCAAHPYTKALLASRPAAVAHWTELRPIAGAPPSKVRAPQGCAFAPRCPMVKARCRDDAPELLPVDPGHASRCHFRAEVARG